jgi:hypothetical protein
LPITRVYDGQNNKQKRLRASSDNLSEKGEHNSAANKNVWSHVLDDEVNTFDSHNNPKPKSSSQTENLHQSITLVEIQL